MKKSLLPLLSSFLFATTVTFAYAQSVDMGVVTETTVTPTPAATIPRNEGYVKSPIIKRPSMDQVSKAQASSKARAAAGTVGTTSLIDAMTGDKVVDERMKVLRKEFQGKLKALIEEYHLKAKAIIGDRKVRMMVSEGADSSDESKHQAESSINAERNARLLKAKNSEERAHIEAEMKAKMESLRDKIRNGTTSLEMKAKIEAQRRSSGERPNGKVTLPPVRPPVRLTPPPAFVEPMSALRGFFRSLFGGTAVEAQARVQ